LKKIGVIFTFEALRFTSLKILNAQGVENGGWTRCSRRIPIWSVNNPMICFEHTVGLGTRSLRTFYCFLFGMNPVTASVKAVRPLLAKRRMMLSQVARMRGRCFSNIFRQRQSEPLHIDSFDPANVRRFCMPWLLDPFCFLSACPRSVCAAARFLPAMSFWLGLLLLMRPCLLVNVCLLLAWCTVA
jgi:hypothetical protein